MKEESRPARRLPNKNSDGANLSRPSSRRALARAEREHLKRAIDARRREILAARPEITEDRA
jgi:hypothetical protein